MFSDSKQNEMLVRLYAKSRAIGHVPSFQEMNEMRDMPPANRFALHCGSYDKAARIVRNWLTAKPMTVNIKLSKKEREEMKVQDERIKAGWIPICDRISTKSFQDLLDEVFAQADADGVLPRDYRVDYDLRIKLDQC